MTSSKTLPFHAAAAMIFIAVAVVAFSPRYLLPLLGGSDETRWILHAHAISGFLWLLLFTAQMRFIQKKNIRTHRTFGFFSFPLAIILVATGVYVTLELFWRARGLTNPGANPVLLVNLSDMLIFGVLYAVGVMSRRRTHDHKAMMFLAALSLMNAASFRIIALITGPGPVPVVRSHILMAGFIALYLLWFRRRQGELSLLVKLIGASYLLVILIHVPFGLSPLWAPVSDLFASMAS